MDLGTPEPFIGVSGKVVNQVPLKFERTLAPLDLECPSGLVKIPPLHARLSAKGGGCGVCPEWGCERGHESIERLRSPGWDMSGAEAAPGIAPKELEV